MSTPALNPQAQKDDFDLETTLRPHSFNEYIGQKRIKENLRILIQAARKRKEAADHILLCGSAGLGKTTLAHIIAKEMGTNIKVTSGPAIEKTGDLASILSNLGDGDVLFIDECHRMNRNIEETLYPAMEDFFLDIVIGKGPSARTLQLELPHFTLIGATTRAGLISSPLRSRFGASLHLNFYKNDDIEKIITRSARILNVAIQDQKALKIIAQSSRRTPRIANRLLKRARDYSQVKSDGIINQKTARETFQMLEIDELGLEPTDRRILRMIIKKFNGGPVGLQAIAAATYEEPETIAEVNEPYLLQLGFLDITSRGRIATKLAYNHLNLRYN